MSLVNRNNLSYQYCVEQYFLSFIKSGVALSPLDSQTIKSWKKRGVPLNIVCAGIKKGVESYKKTYGPYKPPPRSIKYCEGLVEKEFINYKRLKVGAHLRLEGKADEKKVLLRGIDALINKMTNVIVGERDEKLKGLYNTVRNRIVDLGSNIDKNYLYIHAELEKTDRFFLDEFCKLISPDELASVMEETEEKLSLHKFRMNKEAYERTLGSLRNLLVRKRYGLLSVEFGD